jgi:diguanylate cyclase (GGDEF)-like protein
MLANRLAELIDQAGRAGECLAMLIIDLDHFKSINDAFGHRRGDQLLTEFAARVRAVIRSSDLLFRYGGDEFVLALPHTSPEQAVTLANRLLEHVGAEALPGEPPIALTLSIGVAVFPDDASSHEGLFDIADQRLNAAKRRGRGMVVAGDILSTGERSTHAGRLIERDAQLAAAQTFLNVLPDYQRGMLVLSGPRGAGRSALLGEIGRAGSVRGHVTFTLRARAALRTRPFAVLAEQWRNWGSWDLAAQGPEALAEALRVWLATRAAAGLLILVDDLAQLDDETRRWIAHVLDAPPVPITALIYVGEPGDFSMPELYHCQTLELHPLSPGGLRIWLRTLLQWEAPASFVEWLHHSTGGRPTYVKRMLDGLTRHDLLRGSAGLWLLDSAYRDAELTDLLAPATPALPEPAGPFVGRMHEVQAVRAALAEQRLVTLLGPGGSGKTRLALQVAAELQPWFADGAQFVALGALANPEFLGTTLADALGVVLRGPDDALAQVIAALAQRTALIVLDNFEQLVHAALSLELLLEGAPHIRLLVTSRERLRLPSETTIELRGLELPARGDDDAALARSEAVRLFLQRAFGASAPPQIGEELPHIARICRMLGSLPLGIELAAAWARTLPCATIADEIERGFSLLENSGAGSDQQRSLRAVFEHSWRMLAPEEQRILRRLSAFRGPFSLAAASAVAADARSHTARPGSPHALPSALRAIGTLIDKSLLRRVSAERFELHEVIARYSAEALARVPRDRKATLARHVNYYLAVAERQGHALAGANQRSALAAIDLEIENIRAALQYADAESEIQMVGHLWRYWFLRGHFAEWEHALARVRSRRSGVSSASQARALAGSGFLAHFKGESARATQLSVEALALARAAGDPWCTAAALAIVGSTIDDLETGARLLEESVALAHAAADTWLVAFARSSAGAVALYRGRHHAARELLQDSLATGRALGDRWLQAAALFHMGRLEATVGRLAEARASHMAALELRHELGDRLGVAYALLGLAETAMLQGDYDAAHTYQAERMQVEASLGNSNGVIATTGDLGWVAFHQGAYDQATDLLERALAAARPLGGGGVATSLLRLGHVALAQGRTALATARMDESLLHWQQMGHRGGEAMALSGLAEVELALGNASQAARLCRDALALAVETHTASLTVDILVVAAETLAAHANLHIATLLTPALTHPAAAARARQRAGILAARLDLHTPVASVELFALAAQVLEQAWLA